MDVTTFTKIWISIAIGTFILLQFITPPYGRHTHDRFGPRILNHIGWILMEFPSLFCVHFFFWLFVKEIHWMNVFLLSLWSMHYINRTFIYPLRQKDKSKRMPVLIVISAIFFNLINGSVNGYFLGIMDLEAINKGLFILGLVFFVIGASLNLWSDNYLLGLREKGEKKYVIPQKGLFLYVSCPNLLGEMIEWFGFALMAQNWGAWSFAIWTFANLAPRAKQHHQWYLRKFSDYPKKRKILLPFIY